MDDCGGGGGGGRERRLENVGREGWETSEPRCYLSWSLELGAWSWKMGLNLISQE